MFVGDTGTDGENGSYLCVFVILGLLGKMEHSCVWWGYGDSWGKWNTAVCGGDTGTVVENGTQFCVLVILGQLGKMEYSSVCWGYWDCCGKWTRNTV